MAKKPNTTPITNTDNPRCIDTDAEALLLTRIRLDDAAKNRETDAVKSVEADDEDIAEKFDEDTGDDDLEVDVSDLETSDTADEEVDEIVAESEIEDIAKEGKLRRYQHESEIFGKTEVSNGRKKLELLREERLLKEMLGDDF